MDHGATQKHYQFVCLWNVSQRKVAEFYVQGCRVEYGNFSH